MSRRRDILGDVFRNILPLQGFLDNVELKPLHVCIYDAEPEVCLAGLNPADLGIDLPAQSRTTLASICAATMEIAEDGPLRKVLPAKAHGMDAVQYAAALTLFTMEEPFPFYKLVTKPLNVAGVRDRGSLRRQACYFKLLLTSIRLVPRDSEFWCNDVLHRGLSIEGSPLLRAKYDDYRNAFSPGTRITFAAPTSATTDEAAAAAFEGGIRYVIQGATPDCGPGGVRLDAGVSVYDEKEVLLDAPQVLTLVNQDTVATDLGLYI